MYLRTSRLDIDDYNREVHEGLHITSMAGTWMSVVQGFGGMKIRDEELYFTPKLPAQWKGLAFSILWRGATLKANLTAEGMTIENVSGAPAKFAIDGQWFEVAAGENASTAAAAHA
jgi:maltose phosphorylase